MLTKQEDPMNAAWYLHRVTQQSPWLYVAYSSLVETITGSIP